MNPIDIFLTNILFTIISWTVCGFIGGWLAARKGYWPLGGIILGILGGPCALVLAVFLPRSKTGREQAAFERQLKTAPRRANCPECGREIPFGSRACPFCQYQI
jgi:hypothetical protein